MAFGTLTQLVLENAPVDEIETVAALCHSVGLPITLAQLDIKGDIPTKMRLVAEAACAEGETIHNMPGGVDSDQVYAALLVADQYGQRFLQEWGIIQSKTKHPASAGCFLCLSAGRVAHWRRKRQHSGRTHAQRMADGVAHFGAVQGVEVEIFYPFPT